MKIIIFNIINCWALPLVLLFSVLNEPMCTNRPTTS